MLGLTPKEVAVALNVSVETVRRHYRDGRWTGYRVGGQIRINPEQFKDMLGAAYGDFLSRLGGEKEAREPAPPKEIAEDTELSSLL